MTDEAKIEAEIQAKGLNAPRLNPDMVDAAIVSEQYHVFTGTTMTVSAVGGGVGTRPGVRENRGAGACCTMPSSSIRLLRATM